MILRDNKYRGMFSDRPQPIQEGWSLAARLSLGLEKLIVTSILLVYGIECATDRDGLEGFDVLWSCVQWLGWRKEVCENGRGLINKGKS